MQQPQIVVKSNHIISASYELSVLEQRIILTCISQIRRDEVITDDVLYSVSVDKLIDLCSTNSKSIYAELAVAAKRLYERSIVVLYQPDGTKRSEMKQEFRWVQRINYIKNEARIELRFSKDILPYLTNLSERFTRYSLSDVAKMSSSYAIRLFELLSQYSHVGTREIELNQLRQWFMLENKYPSIKDFKKWVLDPAVQQINEHSPISVSWDQRKTGRKVTHLQFTFSPKETALPVLINDSKSPKKRSVITKAEAEKFAKVGETYEMLYQRLSSDYIIRG